MLRGDGKGSLATVPGQESGIAVYGDARGAAVADYDADARVDLVVAQNGAATRLFRNRLAQPGLRVKLSGPPGNPNGVGAAVRLVWGERQGPVREVQAGSGYWSQSSSTLVDRHHHCLLRFARILCDCETAVGRPTSGPMGLICGPGLVWVGRWVRHGSRLIPTNA